MDLWLHLALFVLLTIPIVVLGAFYSEQEDKAALASIPRRLGVFLLSCGLLTAVMLFCEHTFASVN